MQIIACVPGRRARVRLHKAVGSEYAIAWAAGWDEIEALVRQMAVDVIVVDPLHGGRLDLEPVCRLRERYPSVPVVIFTDFRADLAESLLAWGDAGVCGAAFLDQSDSEWDLRRLVDLAKGRSAAEQVLRTLQRDLPGLGEEVRRVLRVGLYEATTLHTAEQWGGLVGLTRRRLYRMFEEAGLPTPKTCLQWLRLLYAAKSLSDPGVSVEDVVFRMRYSAPQNFRAHVHKLLGITPSEMRWSVTVEDLADRFVELCRHRARMKRVAGTDPT
ncbi:MAG: helix-turn-helix domain-containing protein [Gemmatimonadota bacterium]|nr:MAG: helix-turn-helix domain-containing protein [Gemmatimonadota bacterium]